MTTVSELIARLEKLPQDRPVILARDEEGNCFMDVNELGTYYVDNTEVGQYDGVTSEEDLKDSYGEDYAPFVQEVVVLWP